MAGKKRGRKPGVTFNVLKICTCGKQYKYEKCYWACLKSHIRERNKKGIMGLFDFVETGDANPDIKKVELMIFNEDSFLNPPGTIKDLMINIFGRNAAEDIERQLNPIPDLLINPNSLYLEFMAERYNLLSRILSRGRSDV